MEGDYELGRPEGLKAATSASFGFNQLYEDMEVGQRSFPFISTLQCLAHKKRLKLNSLSTRTLKSKGIHSLWHEMWILAFHIG